MANRPVILSVDDDPEVLRAVARDLRKQYNREYRVMSVDSGELALETLRELQVREEPRRMPRFGRSTRLESIITCSNRGTRRRQTSIQS
jgi:CheY-like chemotaxis protein